MHMHISRMKLDIDPKYRKSPKPLKLCSDEGLYLEGIYFDNKIQKSNNAVHGISECQLLTFKNNIVNLYKIFSQAGLVVTMFTPHYRELQLTLWCICVKLPLKSYFPYEILPRLAFHNHICSQGWSTHHKRCSSSYTLYRFQSPIYYVLSVDA